MNKKIKSFVKEFVAIVKGDDAKATGEKVYRQASSALQTQLASLKGDLISKEDAIADAEENLKKARLNNGVLISNRNNYVENLLKAENALTEAKEQLELHQAKIDCLQKHLTLLDQEEEDSE